MGDRLLISYFIGRVFCMKRHGQLLSSASLIAFTYVGTVVGAGFASGQEIMSFFTIYGTKSIWAILISFLLFIVIGSRILILGMELDASSFGKLIEKIFGFLSPVVNLYLLFAMMVINTAMLAGAGAMFEEMGDISYIIGVMVTALVAITTIAFGIKGILSINKIIVIAILIFQVFVFAVTLFSGNTSPCKLSNNIESIQAQPFSFLFQGLTYGSFNLILSTGVLASLGNEFKDRRVLKLGGILGGCILGIMLLSIHYCLLMNMPGILDYEIPMIYIITQFEKSDIAWLLQIIYALVLWGGIFTTLIGNLFSMTSFLQEKYRVNQLLSATIIICIGIILAPLGFSSIVNSLYPVLGVIGIIFIVAILFRSGRRKA